jgi:hypothetical protein
VVLARSCPTALVKTALVKTALVKTALVKTALVKTRLCYYPDTCTLPAFPCPCRRDMEDVWSHT